MSFNLLNLRSDARYLVFGDSTNTAYGDTDLDRNINRWYNTILAWILGANGDWQVNGDFVTTSIVALQREYILPTDLLKLNEVYIKSTSTGDYLKATQKDLSALQHNEDYHPITPEFDVLDNSLFIYTPEDTIGAVTDGLKIVYQKNLTELSNTTDAPNLSEPFKRGISIGAALDYCIANEMNAKAKSLKVLLDELKQELLSYYSTKSTAREIILQPAEENFT
jgi:hypothetical protein